MKRSLCPLFVLVLWTFGPPEAGARSGNPAQPPGSVEQARARFQKGVKLYKEQSFDAALAEFEKAYELAPDHRLLYNLAQVQTERHDYVAALALFRRYLGDGGAAVGAERRAEVESALDLSGLIAELEVIANVDGAEVLLDGGRAGVLPLGRPLLVSAGVHTVLVRKPGHTAAQRTLTVAGGETRSLEVVLAAEAAPVAPMSLPAPPPLEVRSRTPVWLSLLTATALGATAGILAERTTKARRDFEGSLAAFPGDPRRIEDDRSRLRLYAGLTDGFAAAAIVATGFFAYFALSGGAEDAEPRAAQTVRLRLGAGPSGVRISGRF